MPARKSGAAKSLAGTARRDRTPKTEPAERLLTAPRPPKHLSERAAREWRRLAPLVVGLGTMTAADFPALELLAATMATAAHASETIELEGLSTTTADGSKKSHPALRVLERARSQARALLADFGLNPRARQSLDIHPPQGANPFLIRPQADPFDEFLRTHPGSRAS